VAPPPAQAKAYNVQPEYSFSVVLGLKSLDTPGLDSNSLLSTKHLLAVVEKLR